jgi:hypothetical protein
VVKIKFKKSLSAKKCIELMHKRYFDCRELECFYFDGKTNYNYVPENAEETKRRIDGFGKWLEDQIDNQQIFENI